MIAGRYTLDREVGRGGMGAVWLGHDELLDRAVALKRIGMLPGTGSTDLGRAEREARLTARFNHPHVVSVFDLVEDADGTQWLVMEYVDGTTLARLVQEHGALAPDHAAPLVWQVADALVAAHAAGIVHRDVKPSNVLVDRQGQAKLTDFGIARALADPSLTQTGMVTGSPAYLAPEVVAGERGGAAADVWSLGATVFHVLAGRPPYDLGDHVLGGLYRIVNEEPPRLPAAGWLAPLLDGTMVKDPELRWSMRQVRDFLPAPGARLVVPVAVGPGSSAAPPAPPDPDPEPTVLFLQKNVSRNRAVLGLVAAALVVVVAMVLVAVLPGGDRPGTSAGGPGTSPAGPTATPAPTATTPHATTAPGPTVAGMRAFVHEYVAALAANPDAAWAMLTPGFQRASGGLETYREFWSGVGTGHVRDVRADPERLVVSYRVRFDHFGTGRRPTVLKLEYDDGRYRIAEELTEGFIPAA